MTSHVLLLLGLTDALQLPKRPLVFVTPPGWAAADRRADLERVARVVRATGRGAGRAGDAAAAGRAVVGGVDGWRRHAERDGVAVAAVRAAGGAGRVVSARW